MILDLIPLRYHSRPENLDPIDKCGVGVKFDNIEILDSVCNLKLLLTLEAFYIRQRRPGLNTRDEFRSRALSSTCFSPPRQISPLVLSDSLLSMFIYFSFFFFHFHVISRMTVYPLMSFQASNVTDDDLFNDRKAF